LNTWRDTSEPDSPSATAPNPTNLNSDQWII
jgi:hypothetical protein